VSHRDLGSANPRPIRGLLERRVLPRACGVCVERGFERHEIVLGNLKIGHARRPYLFPSRLVGRPTTRASRAPALGSLPRPSPEASQNETSKACLLGPQTVGPSAPSMRRRTPPENCSPSRSLGPMPPMWRRSKALAFGHRAQSNRQGTTPIGRSPTFGPSASLYALSRGECAHIWLTSQLSKFPPSWLTSPTAALSEWRARERPVLGDFWANMGANSYRQTNKALSHAGPNG
jgi:hypothetical protein